MSQNLPWTAEALDYATRSNFDQQTELANRLYELDRVPFWERSTAYRLAYLGLVDQLDDLQVEAAKLALTKPGDL